jgi:hypothetical protein
VKVIYPCLQNKGVLCRVTWKQIPLSLTWIALNVVSLGKDSGAHRLQICPLAHRVGENILFYRWGNWGIQGTMLHARSSSEFVAVWDLPPYCFGMFLCSYILGTGDCKQIGVAAPGVSSPPPKRWMEWKYNGWGLGNFIPQHRTWG